MRYRAFRTKKDNQFYFQFLTDGGDLVLKSQAYASKADCFNGIRSVMENASNTDRYESMPGEGGTFAFRIKASNNQEIGRSVEYNSELELNNMIALFRAQAPKANSGTPAGDKPAATPEVTKSSSTSSSGGGGSQRDDDYRPLAFYQARISGVDNGFDTFTDTDNNEYYFTYNQGGNIILISEGYNSEASRDNGIKSVTTNMTNPDRYKRGIHKNGRHYFDLRAGNNQEIATSRWCDTAEEMEQYISGMTGGGAATGSSSVKSSKAPVSSKLTSAGTEDTTKTKKKKPKTPKAERVYITQNGSYACNDITYDTFKSGGNDRYYFVFKSKEDKAVLINGDVRGFADEDALNEGIAKVLALAPNPENYLRKASKNGKHYFYVTDSDDKNIARGSLFYNNEEDMNVAIKLLACGAGMAKAAPAAASAGSGLDEYLPCEAYTTDSGGFHSFVNDDNGEYYFSYNANNGLTLLRSQGYKSEAARDNGIKSVKKNGPIEERWTASEDGGQYYYALKAGNHQEIARSCPHGSIIDRNAAYASAYDAFAPKPEVVASMTAAAGGGATAKDEYLPCEAYAGSAGFHTFESDGEYYFGYNNADGKTMLRSEGYTTEKARDNGIESVKKNAPIEERWTASEDGGQYYYALKAGNHQEIARSCPYGSVIDRNAAYAGAYDAFAPKPEIVASMTAGGGGATAKDEYLPCEAYAGSAGFHTFESDGEYYFGYNNADGKTMLRSEGYTTEKARDNGIESVKKNAPIEERWTASEDGGQYYYALKAGNHQEIARSCPYGSVIDRNAAYAGAYDAFAPKPEVVASMTATGGGATAKDEYLPCEAYAGSAGFHTFESDGEYYFGYNNADGKTMLRSEGYTTEKARDNGIESVKKNGPIEERWTASENGGQYYYALKAGNHQEIARSCPYGSIIDRNAAYAGAYNAFAPKPEVVASMTATGTGATAKDEYLPCEAYAGASGGFHTFVNDDNGEYYFSYNDSSGQVILRSEGYKTEAARDNGIESVKNNASIEKRWTTEEDGGQYYYALKAGNHQEIARSCPYDSEEEMNRAYSLGLFAFAEKTEVPPAPEPEVVKASAIAPTPPPAPEPEPIPEPEAPKVEKIVDDYMPCEAYTGAAGFHSFYDENRNEYFFAYNDEDGNTLLRSEGYKTTAARDNGIESVKKNAPIEGRWKKETALNGKYHYYVLRAGNNQEIARSCYYEDREKMSTNFMLLGGAFAPIVASTVVEKVAATPPPPPPKPKEKEDDYLKCTEYANRKVNDKINNIALFKHDNGQYYFAVYNEDGSVRLRSEGFKTSKGRDQELSGTLKYMNNEDMYETIQKGKYYINVLKDDTGREVARSCMKTEKVAFVPPAILAGGLAAGLAGVGAAGGKVEEKVVVVPPTPPPPPAPKEVATGLGAAGLGAAAATGAYASSGSASKEEKKKKGGFPWWWLLLLLIPLLFFLLRGCDGCNKTVPPPPPPIVPVDTVDQITEAPKVAPCPLAGDLKLAPGAGANVAEYLSDPESTLPHRFTFDNVGFGRNGARLRSAGKKSLDDLVVCLKGCPGLNVDIYGHITNNESSSYRGSKEVSLDDVRAKAVYDYLKSRGIEEGRMSFQGEGTGDNNNIVIQLNN